MLSAQKEAGREFARKDEEVLAMFASQAAAVGNARRHRAEQRVRANLEVLVDTSPVGVVVFDARTGHPVSLNREAKRIVGGLSIPRQSPEQLLEVVSWRRADGREISLKEFPLEQVLSSATTVRAEEIVFQVPDGWSVTTRINATPIHSEGGAVESMVVTMQDQVSLEEMERLRIEFLSVGGRRIVQIDLPPDLPRVRAEGRRIVQVLNNLFFSNASRHSPESSPIRFTAGPLPRSRPRCGPRGSP